MPIERRPTGRLGNGNYTRLLDYRLTGIGLEADLFGTHSLRRTKATAIYRRTGNLRTVQHLLGHTKHRPLLNIAAKRGSESTEKQLAQLRGRYADLADKVVAGELRLAAAFAKADRPNFVRIKVLS